MQEEPINKNRYRAITYLGRDRNLLRLILFLCISIYFQTFRLDYAFSQPDSLSKYLEIAEKNNPLLLQKFNEYQAALQRVPQAGGLTDPELKLGVFLKPMELVTGNQVADITLMQMFPWFGVLKSAKDEMSLMANAKFELLRDARIQVWYDVQSTWYELFKIHKEIRISEKNIEILKTIERLAIIKIQAGSSQGSGSSASRDQTNSSSSRNDPGTTGTQGMEVMQKTSSNPEPMQSGSMTTSTALPGLADLYRIQIEMGDLQNSIALLKDRQKTISSRFNSYLNRPPETVIFIPDSIQTDTLKQPVMVLSDSVMKNNPMLVMLEYEKQSLDARGKMVKNMGYPMVGLGLNYSVISKNEMSASPMNGKDMIMPMVSVTLPVYRKKYNARVKEIELLKTSLTNNYTATSNSLLTEFSRAAELYRDAERRIKLFDNQYLLASKSLDLMTQAFAVSSASMTDLLRVRQQTLDYELKMAEARADFYTASALLTRLIASKQTGNH